MLRRQLQIGGALQFAVLDQRGDAPMQRAGHPFARDYRQIQQLRAETLQVVALRQFGDQLLIGQFARLAHAVDENDALEALPGLEVLQDRQKRGDPGAGGQQPEVSTIGKAIQRQEAEGLLVHQQLVAHLEPAQLTGEFAVRHHDGEEIEKLVVRRRYHGVGTPDNTAAGLAHAEAGELPGGETKAGVAAGAQGEQVGRQRLHLEQALAGELLFAGGHTSLPPSISGHLRGAP